MAYRSVARQLPPGFWPALAYLAMALVGVWAAYDRGLAWSRFALIGLGLALALGLAWAGARAGERALGLVGLACALAAAVVGGYFLVTFDWVQAGAIDFAVLRRLGLVIEAHQPAALPGAVHPNAAGGALAVLLPLGLAGLGWAWVRRWRLVALIAALAVLLALVALVLSSSRGAWSALAAGAVVAGCRRWRRSCPGSPRTAGRPGAGWLVGTLVVVLALLAAAGAWLALTQPGFERIAGRVIGAVGGSGPSRVDLWRRVLPLVQDYLFTGSGFGSTTMAYSSYVLLIHVPYFAHAHNLFLQIALDQGVPGLLAFLWLAGSGLRAAGSAPEPPAGRGFRAAALASVVTLLVHGLLDAELYSSDLLPIMFLPIGFSLAFTRPRSGVAVASPRSAGRRARAVWLAALALGVVALLLPGPRAAFLANLGAVAQTRAELSVYRWETWGFQDAVRRSPAANLAPAIASYQAALALDAANATANRRLGQIELSLGQYAAARRHLEAAYQAAPFQRATRLLLGESYAIAGELEPAADLWATVDQSQGELKVRIAWHSQLRENQPVAWMLAASTLAGRKEAARSAR